MHRSAGFVVLSAAVGLAGSPALAQRRAPECSADGVARALASAFEATYVLPGQAAAGARELRRAVREKRLDADAGPARLADGLEEILKRATEDGHVAVEWIDPEGPPPEEADWIARWRARAPRENYGVARVEILPGNVGYLELRSFHTYAQAAPTLRAAMALVRHTDGMILDLRNNGGGDGETAGAVERTFLGPDARSPLRIESRRGVEPVSTPAPLEWERYGTERPLAILINGRSFSASEAVAFGLASSGRATTVGARSAGGAHMTDAATPLPCGFRAWIPNRRPFDPRTRTNWERTGVVPHVQADTLALPVAHLHLLRRLREAAAGEEERAQLDRSIAQAERQAAAAPAPF